MILKVGLMWILHTRQLLLREIQQEIYIWRRTYQAHLREIPDLNNESKREDSYKEEYENQLCNSISNSISNNLPNNLPNNLTYNLTIATSTYLETSHRKPYLPVLSTSLTCLTHLTYLPSHMRVKQQGNHMGDPNETLCVTIKCNIQPMDPGRASLK